MALRLLSYWERRWIVSDLREVGWSEGTTTRSSVSGDVLQIATRIVEGGDFPGSEALVLTISRNDKWADDEVPVLGPSTDENTTSTSRTIKREGNNIFALTSERRLAEWFEAGAHSRRVKYDSVPSDTRFIVDVSGETWSADRLNNEDVGRWLFFRPEVIRELLGRRGVSMSWYTRFTFGVQSVDSPPVHLGINPHNLVVAYAYDIARQDEWQRRIWAAFNVAPEGGLGEELHSAQVRSVVARSNAPEAFLPASIDSLNHVYERKTGDPLWKKHADFDDILGKINRFRSLDKDGFLALAKDIARITADSFNLTSLHKLSPPGKDGSGKGSLKSLERALTVLAPKTDAQVLLTKLVGVYELRLADAHIPTSELAEAFRLAGVPLEGSWLLKGAILIHSVVTSLLNIIQAISDSE